MIRLNASMPEDAAAALAQFCKRSTFKDFQRRAVDEAEAGQMIAAIVRLQDALAVAGVEPR